MPKAATTTTVLILAAGHSSAVHVEKGEYPVCLSEMDNRPLLEHIVGNATGIEQARFVYAMLEQEVRRYHLDSVVQLLTPGATVVRVPEKTKGAACTALLAACHVEAESELLIVSANELVALDFGKVLAGFRQRELDAGVLAFRSVHPRYSYVRLDEDDLVSEAAQRKPISHHATTGLFWFRRAGDFVAAVKDMIRKDAQLDGIYYICPSLNELVLKQRRVGASHISSAAYFPIKSERQLSMFEQSHGVGIH
jgi:dTDP-glucose pyrophosphorylase